MSQSPSSPTKKGCKDAGEMSHQSRVTCQPFTQNASTETLTEEQQYFLQLSPRQEPQGEENVRLRSIPSPSIASNLDSHEGNLSHNTLIIHGSMSDDGLLRSPASFSIEDLAKQQVTSTPGDYSQQRKRNTFPRRREGNNYPNLDAYGDPDPVEKRAHLRSALGAAYREQMKVLEEITKETRHLNMLDRYLDDVSHYSAPSSSESSGSRFSQFSTMLTDRDDVSRLSISDTLLAEGISPFGQRQNRLSASSTCSSAYDSWMNDVLRTPQIAPSLVLSPKRQTRLRRTVSRSQPDLSKIKQKYDMPSPIPVTCTPEMLLVKATSPRKSPKVETDECWTNGELLDTLLQENLILKEEIRLQAGKLERLEKLESELCAVQANHQALVRLNERRESLERTARLRLENEVRNLQDINKDLHNQVDLLTGRILSNVGTESLDREISQRDMVIAQLVSQNKELIMLREQQEMELSAQRATLQEQRKHIDLLDAALAAKSQCKCQLQQYNHLQQQNQVQSQVQQQQELGVRRLDWEAGGLRSSQRSQGSVRSTGTDSGDSGITTNEQNLSSPPPAYPLPPTSDSGHLRQQLWEAQKHIEMLRSQMTHWQRPPGAIYEPQPPAVQLPVPPQDVTFQRSNLRATVPVRRPSPLPPRASLRSLPPTKFSGSRGPAGSVFGSSAQIANSSLSIASKSDQRTRDFSSPGRVDLGHTPAYYRVGHSPSPCMARTPSTGSGNAGKFPTVRPEVSGGARCQLTSYRAREPEVQQRADSMIQGLRNEQQRYPGHFQ